MCCCTPLPTRCHRAARATCAICLLSCYEKDASEEERLRWRLSSNRRLPLGIGSPRLVADNRCAATTTFRAATLTRLGLPLRCTPLYLERTERRRATAYPTLTYWQNTTRGGSRIRAGRVLRALPSCHAAFYRYRLQYRTIRLVARLRDGRCAMPDDIVTKDILARTYRVRRIVPHVCADTIGITAFTCAAR